jgi:hypothetical protein
VPGTVNLDLRSSFTSARSREESTVIKRVHAFFLGILPLFFPAGCMAINEPPEVDVRASARKLRYDMTEAEVRKAIGSAPTEIFISKPHSTMKYEDRGSDASLSISLENGRVRRAEISRREGIRISREEIPLGSPGGGASAPGAH